MQHFHIPTREEVSSGNRQYFDFFHETLGMMPNIYAMLAHSDTGLESYLHLQSRRQLISRREREIIGLVVAAINSSVYCLETHSMIAKLNGFSEEEIAEIKMGTACFDVRYDALAQLTCSIVKSRGLPDPACLQRFFDMRYTHAHLVDLVLCIGDNTISNLLTRTMDIPTDFPAADDRPFDSGN